MSSKYFNKISAQNTEPNDFLRDYIKIEVVEIVGHVTSVKNYKTTGNFERVDQN